MSKPNAGFTPHILLVAIVLSGISTFMMYPLLVFRLIDLGLNLGEIGMILGALYGTGRLTSFLIGTANNRWGSKLVVCLGLACRVIGISVFAFNTTFVLYLLCAALASIGSSSAALGIKTELLRISASRKFITLRSMAINSGAIVGPALGAALYHFLSFLVILYTSIAIYVLLIIVLFFTRFAPPEAALAKKDTKEATAKGYKGYIIITLLAALYWAIYSQWSIVVPLMSEQAFGEKEFSNMVYMLNAVIVLALQYPLLVILLKSVKDSTILSAGFILFFFSFLCVLPSPAILTVGLFCMSFSVAELLISPTLDSQTAQLAPAQLGLTKAYGFQDTFTGLFSMGGSTLGGWLIEHSGGVSGSAFLGIPVAVCAVLAAYILRIYRKA